MNETANNDTVHTTAALESCTAELAQAKERLLYISADFDNYRRRIEKEKIQWTQIGQEHVLRDFLELVDNFERAEQELADKSGFELLYKSAKKLLQTHGVEEMTHYSTFDPHLHEALMSAPAEGKESGTIIQVFQKGYMFKGSVLRPAKVSVVQ